MKSINRLQQKWGVGGVQFWLIIVTFAFGGSLSGYLNKQILNLVFLEKNMAYWAIYPVLLTILWPFSVIFISFFTGQFVFFKGYLGRMWGKLTGKKNTPVSVALFASGAGSNARKIIEYFEQGGEPMEMGEVAGGKKGPTKKTTLQISLIVCNVPDAGVLGIAKEKGIPTLIINKTAFDATGYVESLANAGIQFIVLAGFLWKLPAVLIHAYPKAIVNIHPALLPKYGGKGMYGEKVHAAVLAAGEKESGITIHWVDAQYDEGDIIFQARCTVEPTDTTEKLAAKIHALEHAHYAPTIAKLLKK